MSRDSDQEDSRLTHEVALRAIRRLDILEWVTLGGAAVLAIAGGALVALLLEDLTGWGYRTLWIVTALLLFAIPGGVTFVQLKREEAESRRRLNRDNDESHG